MDWLTRTNLSCSGMFRLTVVAAGVSFALSVQAAQVTGLSDNPVQVSGAGDEALSFDSDFLTSSGEGVRQHVDLSYFAHKGGMLPGVYTVQVMVNGRVVDDNRSVTFNSWPDNPGKLYACVTAEELQAWWGITSSPGRVKASVVQGGSAGQDVTADAKGLSPVVSGDVQRKGAANACPVGGVVTLVPWSKEEFDFNKRVLTLTVPQASLGPQSEMRTSPQSWDRGLPALLMNYNYSGNQQQGGLGSDYLGLNGQLNLLGWRISNNLNWYRSQGESGQWNASDVSAQHDYSMAGGGQLTVGNTSSDGGSVDSVQFSGMKVDSDPGMLDPKYASYTPAVTGFARSPATVAIRQYGKVIYQQNVPQGPFSLTDYNSSGNGDLDIEIREADGQTRHYSMSTATVGKLMRDGEVSYSASSGRATNGAGYLSDKFVQGNASWGAWANTSLNGGVLLSPDYLSAGAGTALNAGIWGALSYSFRYARTNLSVVPDMQGVANGFSHSVSWSRGFGGMSLGMSVSRSENQRYYGYQDAVGLKKNSEDDNNTQSGGSKYSYTLILSQSLGVWGSLSLSGTRSTFWGNTGAQKNATASYNTTVKDIGISLSLGYSTWNGSSGSDDNDEGYTGCSSCSSGGDKTDKTISLTLSLPLAKWLNVGGMSGNYTYTRYGDQTSQQAGVSGTALNDEVSYSVSQGLGSDHSGNSSLGYSGRYGSLNGGYSYGNGARSLSYGGSGAFALHQHGITLGRTLSLDGGNALVSIPDAADVDVGGAITDWRGYALLTGLTPYDRNNVAVDMTRIPGNMELDTTSKSVIPSRGALVYVPFRSHAGYRLMLTLTRDKGAIPFGSVASLVQEESSDVQPVTGIVGEDGMVYLSGLPAAGKISVQWGDDVSDMCIATYSTDAGMDMNHLNTLTLPCVNQR